MVSQPIWIAIVIGVFFVGIGVSYTIFSLTDEPTSMKFTKEENVMNKVSHFEIPYENQERVQQFYQEVFGWEISKFSDEGYFLAFTTKSDPNTMMPLEPGAINGGLLKRDSTAKNPLLVIDVSNLDEHIKKIEDAGGELIMPKVRVGDSGFFARVVDTEGNVIFKPQ